MEKESIKIFISYAHNDKAYFEVFIDTFKKSLKHSENISWNIWNDKNIHIGSLWDDEIKKHVNNTHIAILLVSDSFLASDYIEKNEFNKFIERCNKEELLIFPILFAPCNFNRWSDLAQRQFFMPTGDNYGKKEIKDFTFADLIKFNESDGSFLPNPNINRYVNDCVTSLENAHLKNTEIKKSNSIQSLKKINTQEDIINSIDADTWFNLLLNTLEDTTEAKVYLRYFGHPEDAIEKRKKEIEKIMSHFSRLIYEYGNKVNIVGYSQPKNRNPIDWLIGEISSFEDITNEKSNELVKKSVSIIGSQPVSNSHTVYLLNNNHLFYTFRNRYNEYKFYEIDFSNSIISHMLNLGFNQILEEIDKGQQ